MDKKIYQKLQRYEDDKANLYTLYIQDQLNQSKPHYNLKLDFQSDEAQKLFENSIPECIKRQCRQKQPEILIDADNSADSNVSTNFETKLKQILEAIKYE